MHARIVVGTYIMRGIGHTVRRPFLDMATGDILTLRTTEVHRNL